MAALPAVFRKWQAEFDALGNIPAVVALYIPRLFISCMVVVVAQFCRFGAWCIDETSDIIRQPKINKRILIVTDYLPPQTHGIAIRFQQYITHMRKRGHEVHVFATTQRPELETSWDHPRLPSVVNPWNIKNRMAYNPGVRLAWTLGSRQWDVVHVVYPSLIGAFIIAVCGWRRIPVYCSHHVDIDFYAKRCAPAWEGWGRVGLGGRFGGLGWGRGLGCGPLAPFFKTSGECRHRSVPAAALEAGPHPSGPRPSGPRPSGPRLGGASAAATSVPCAAARWACGCRLAGPGGARLLLCRFEPLAVPA
jgi:hypothetical protein